ncbi:MAG: carboxypeptidase-like regulatory domain-containing protein, partial [Lewinella sp.]|nr:carboxypeptidase-like regulatory domain-containing protein [Lewinella sp.]
MRLIATLLTLFCFSSILLAQVTITGSVIDRRSGQPLPLAEVRVGNQDTKTNSLGDFSLLVNLPAGEETQLTIREKDHQDYNQSLTIGTELTLALGILALLPGDNLT